MMQVVETFGPGLVARMGVLAVGYMAWASAPFWWPAMRALRRRRRLRRPVLFSACAGCLAYAGYLAFLVAMRLLLLIVPALPAWLEWLTPQAGITLQLSTALLYGLPLLVFTGWVERLLGARWQQLLAASPDARPAT